MKVKLEAVDRFERDHRLRLPFRFGVITVTQGIQAIIRVRIALEDGRTGEGEVGSTAHVAKLSCACAHRCPSTPRQAPDGCVILRCTA